MKRLLTVFLALCVSGALAAPAFAGGYKLIVNKTNPAASLSRSKIAMMFMKMREKWEDGQAVQPVDQLPSSAVRAAFSKDVHSRDVAAIQTAWQRAVFAGRGTPPPEKASDEDVVAFVAANPGGIGYVGESAAVDRVKVVEVTK
jgi:ABC-type phosphate transport system substrate-binding protein